MRTLFIALLLLVGRASAHTHLLAPNGGELLPPGSVFTIAWEVQIQHDTQNWDVWYSTTGQAGPWLPIATDLPAGDTSAGAQHSFLWTVPNTPSADVRVRVRQDNSAMDYEDVSDADLSIGSACMAANVCSTAPNSFGPGAIMSHQGPLSIAANDFQLEVTSAVPGEPGIFYYGATQIETPFGEGFRCIAGSTIRVYPFGIVDANGSRTHHLDFTQPPANAGPGAIVPMSTWYVQYWYRDPSGGGSGFNLSDALEVTFCP